MVRTSEPPAMNMGAHQLGIVSPGGTLSVPPARGQRTGDTAQPPPASERRSGRPLRRQVRVLRAPAVSLATRAALRRELSHDLAIPQARGHADGEDREDGPERLDGGDVHVGELEHHLDADEAEDDRHRRLEVDKVLHRLGQKHVQVAQPEDREDVRGEHHKRILGDAYDGWNRVHCEDHVRELDADEHHQHGRRVPLALSRGEELGAIVVARRRDERTSEPHDGVVVDVFASGVVAVLVDVQRLACHLER
mmetsp:Transcript_3594/g.9327  ORF Transcript_3594/g.9327 Transcript_3594/m.9327 type:complete len:251 (+) Transcript_3594:313-1065(+)